MVAMFRFREPGTLIRYSSIVFAIVMALGCTPQPPRETRPDWNGADIDGIAPLMSPHEIETALARHDYRQIPCESDGNMPASPLFEGSSNACFQTPRRPMMLSLFFLELHEGRRLAVAHFYRRDDSSMSATDLHNLGRAFTQELRDRFGTPSAGDVPEGSVTESDIKILSWNRPGGNPSLPDTISNEIGGASGSGPNVSLASMWAYGQRVDDKQDNAR